MKTVKLFYFLTILMASQLFANTYTSIRNGNFDDPSVWDKSQVPSFEEDTILIYHAIIYNRNSSTFGLPNCVKRPYIFISEVGHLCIDKNDTLYNICLVQRGRFTARELLRTGTEHFVYGSAYSNRSILTIGKFKSAIYVRTPGRYSVDTVKYSCTDGIKIDTTGIYNSKCPQGLLYIRDSLQDSLTLKFWTHAIPYMNFRFQFSDTTIFAKTNDSFTYKMKTKKDFTLYVSSTDICDRAYKYQKKYKFEENNSGIEIKYKPTVEWQFIGNKSIQVRNEDNTILSVIIYDLAGRKIYESTIRGKDEIDMNQNPSGIYYIRILDKDNQLLKTDRFHLP